MDRKPPKTAGGSAGESRTDRLKAALKANVARRKAQAKARSEAVVAGSDGSGGAAGRCKES